MYRRLISALILLAFFCVFWATGCDEIEQPETVHVAVFKGSPYEQGFQHGQKFATHIRSLYTRLLETSIMPFLNREQLNIAPVLPSYSLPRFQDGKFSYQMLLESGQYLYDNYLSEDHKAELQGIADGAEIEFEKILILNTFYDTMMGFRAIVIFIQLIQEPYIDSIEILGDVSDDGIDNNGDGETDDDADGTIAEYGGSSTASLLEVPTDAELRFIVRDPTLLGLSCIDPRNATPLAEMYIDAACVDPACVVEFCKGSDRITRECIDENLLVCTQEDSEERRTCLEETPRPCLVPRVGSDCVDFDCVEINDPGCVNPESIRIQMDSTQYTSEDDAVQIELLEGDEDSVDFSGGKYDMSNNPYRLDCSGPLQVTFSPPGGFPEASTVSLLVQAGDLSPIYSPEPFHYRSMRDERITITTEGYAAKTGSGDKLWQIPNEGVEDPRFQPPSISFAVRGKATPDGDPILAHHYALLDNDMLHEHSLLAVHIPDDGGTPHAVLTWTGMVWGFSGMNADGLAYAVNNSDSLDNPLVGAAIDGIFAHLTELIQNPDLEGLSKALSETLLLVEGVPIGFIGRDILAGDKSVSDAARRLYSTESSYGWNVLLADAEGGLQAVELDNAFDDDDDDKFTGEAHDRDGFQSYTPDVSTTGNTDAHGLPWASVSGDDLRMGSHFVKNADDVPNLSMMGQFAPRMQRGWTGFYFRSLRSFYRLGEEIDTRYGTIDRESAISILRTPDLVDTRDSMNAAVFEPAKGTFHWAMGGVPATDQPFTLFDFATDLQASEEVAQ